MKSNPVERQITRYTLYNCSITNNKIIKLTSWNTFRNSDKKNFKINFLFFYISSQKQKMKEIADTKFSWIITIYPISFKLISQIISNFLNKITLVHNGPINTISLTNLNTLYKSIKRDELLQICLFYMKVLNKVSSAYSS